MNQLAGWIARSAVASLVYRAARRHPIAVALVGLVAFVVYRFTS